MGIFKNGKQDKGWICPGCGKILAPFIVYCPFCADEEKKAEKIGNTEKIESKAEEEYRAANNALINEWLNGEG